MKAQAKQLAIMSETLESSGFSRPQSNAVIESVALAMETFAVTPEILDARIDGLRDEMNAQFAAQGERIEAQGEEIKSLSKSVGRFDARMSALEQSMLEFQRSMMRFMLAFLVLMLGAVVGMFGAIVSQLFVA